MRGPLKNMVKEEITLTYTAHTSKYIATEAVEVILAVRAMIMKGIMEDQELEKFTQKILAKFNLYRTKKQNPDDLFHEWGVLGKLLVSYGAPEILKSADSCCMRLSHFLRA